jgi:hypothetical protein
MLHAAKVIAIARSRILLLRTRNLMPRVPQATYRGYFVT